MEGNIVQYVPFIRLSRKLPGLIPSLCFQKHGYSDSKELATYPPCLHVSEANGALQTRPHFFLSHPPRAPIYGGGDYGMA